MKSSVKMTRKQRIMSTEVAWLIVFTFPIFLISCLFFLPNAEAYLEEVNKVSCPVCGTEVKIFKTLSMTVKGSYRDFQKRINGPYYYQLFSCCPACHFSGYASDFSRWSSIWLSKNIKRKVLNELRPVISDLYGHDVFEFAAKIYKWKKKDNAVIAEIYLFGSYHLKYWSDLKYVDLRKRYQALACEYFIKAVEAKEIKEKDRGAISYLIAELYRRQGEFEKAIVWYDRALKEDNPDKFKNIIREQKEMARNRDPNNDI